jgi:pyruvate dehydrogenase E2 component (dihydrolipoamide acetyltransferase)
MARIPVEMAKLGYDMDSGRISSWTKKVGDAVRRGEVIAEIETTKTAVEMEALTTGTLVEIVQPVGAEVAVGGVIAYIEDGA